MRELPVRKSIRLKGYDYSQAGCYFITICVKDRHELLAHIVGDAAFGVPCAELTQIGTMVKKHIDRIEETSHVLLDHYTIMPNHIHLLISIKNETPNIMGHRTPRAASPTKATIPQLVNALKSLASKEFGESMWQRFYHEHIIRNEVEYRRIWQYINENPARWAKDKYYVSPQF